MCSVLCCAVLCCHALRTFFAHLCTYSSPLVHSHAVPYGSVVLALCISISIISIRPLVTPPSTLPFFTTLLHARARAYSTPPHLRLGVNRPSVERRGSTDAASVGAKRLSMQLGGAAGTAAELTALAEAVNDDSSTAGDGGGGGGGSGSRKSGYIEVTGQESGGGKVVLRTKKGGGGGGGGTGTRQRTRRKSEFQLQEEASINLGVQAGERIAPVTQNAGRSRAETNFGSGDGGGGGGEVWEEASGATKRTGSLVLEGSGGGGDDDGEPHMDGTDLVC